jgi:hypothetical protein
LTEYFAASSSAHVGQLDEARERVSEILRKNPTLRISHLRAIYPELHRPEDFARFADGLRQAGMPE